MKYTKNFKLNDEGRYSMTRTHEQKQIIKIMTKFIGKPLKYLTITDGTSCIGGDLINFSKKFYFVNGVEINPLNYSLLIHNTQGLKNINLINDDYLKVYKKLSQDVIYIDPPWGGPNYKLEKTIDVKLNNFSIKKIIHKIKKYTKYIFIKLPLNAVLPDIIGVCEIIYNKYNIPSFLLLCIDTTDITGK